MKHVGLKTVKINRILSGDYILVEDQVIVESPLEVRIRYRGRLHQVAITMRTPGSDEDLSIGFLFTEGILKDLAHIEEIKIIEDQVIEVTLADQASIPDHTLQRNTYMSSSCGICGKASLDLIKTNTQYLPWSSKFELNIESILSLRNKLEEMNHLFSITGGNHAVALFDLEANLIHMAEDVGRHNAMDKVIGNRLRSNDVPLAQSIGLLSGRASFELIQKAMMAGVGCIVAIGAPSSLAIDLAEECGMTLIGFLKNGSFNIYSGNERVKM